MDPALRKEHDAFKRRAMITPSVEANKTKKPTNSNSTESINKSRPLKRKAEGEPKQEFNYKTNSGRTENNFSILARIVTFLKTRHLDGITHALSLADIADEMDMDLTPRHKFWLSTEALINNPKIEVVDGTLYKFKPIFSIRNGKGLVRLLLNHYRHQLGGIYEEDVEESMPNFSKFKKTHVDEIELVSRPDKKKVVFYFDKNNAFDVYEDALTLWRNTSLEGADPRKIEEYLQKRKIVTMRDTAMKKPVVKKKAARKRNAGFKSTNEHLGNNVLKDYSEK